MVPDVVRQLIRHRIEEGRLPRERTIELWQSPGFGQTCDGCGATITTAETMCLICGDDWRAIRFHRGCFEAWDAERSLGQHDQWTTHQASERATRPKPDLSH